MIRVTCEHCQEVDRNVPIRTPTDLEKAIRVVRDNISAGVIRESQYWPEGILDCRGGVPFSELSDRKSWGDGVDYYFECAKCGRLYHLSVETYHGSGGCWAPFENE